MRSSRMKKTWRRPRITEIPVGLEINGYLPATL